MAYKLAFIGYNEAQTRTYFEDFAAMNLEQVRRFDRRDGVITLHDGTTITRIPPIPEFLRGRRFDQTILADDRRMMILYHRAPELAALARCMDGSEVPEDYRFVIYDLDD